jgi:hypothetical protein
VFVLLEAIAGRTRGQPSTHGGHQGPRQGITQYGGILITAMMKTYEIGTNMLRILIALAVLMPSTAMAQWGYDPSQSAAAAYCAARQAGKSHRQGENAARNAVVNATGGSFANQLGAILTGGRQAMQTANYLAQKMCPEWFEGSSTAASDYRPMLPANAACINPKEGEDCVIRNPFQ